MRARRQTAANLLAEYVRADGDSNTESHCARREEAMCERLELPTKRVAARQMMHIIKTALIGSNFIRSSSSHRLLQPCPPSPMAVPSGPIIRTGIFHLGDGGGYSLIDNAETTLSVAILPVSVPHKLVKTTSRQFRRRSINRFESQPARNT